MTLPSPARRRLTPVVGAAVLAATTATAGLVTAPAQARPADRPVPPQQELQLVEATIDELQKALVTGRTTCTEVVEGYLERIEAYDDQYLSYIELSDTALAEAAALDAQKATRGATTPPLFCVPVVLKDNIDVEGLPTTAGSPVLAGMLPPDDAFVTEQLTDAGAIVLGKANLDEFAFGFGGASALGGQVSNVYDLTRGPGGSSSGTGAAVAASLAMVGLGTDTGGSVRVPSSVEGLVGIRPTMRLVSQDGIIPLALFQDTAGPMCRAVEDCALTLQVMAGFDDADSSGQYTLPQQRDDRGVLLGSEAAYAEVVGVRPDAYTKALKPQGLRNARVGVVRALFGNDPEVIATMEEAIAAMEAAGATVEDVTVPDLGVVTSFTSNSRFEFKDHLTRYLSDRPVDGYPRTFDEVRALTPSRQSTFASYDVFGTDRYANPDYDLNTLERPGYVRPRLEAALDNTTLDGTALGEPYDALLYPSVVSLPRVGGSPSSGSNNRLSPYSGFPALSMPAGFTEATATRPALPVGMELLGREFDEPTLLRLAYGYQEAVEGTDLARQAPTTAPELP
ncbi:amidase [Aquipuribacter sp. SD81]|uniref:amidase n=1 Tax=Aquipuribacter sp. SD81 TaxID=3127703 RepID=UPI003016BD7B